MSHQRTPQPGPGEASVYRIRIRGRLGAEWADWFGGASIAAADDGDTLLTSPAVDQAALHGLLRKVRDLGMPLISVNPAAHPTGSINGRTHMKAISHASYGPPDVLRITDAEQPTPNDNQVLIRVHAVSLNPAEAHMRSGKPIVRLMTRELFRPKHAILGADIAGRIEAVGSNVSQFQPGDEVFGRRSPDGFAEYVCASENPIALKPANLSFEQAAAVPTAGLTALQSLRDTGRLQPGQRVAVNGAAGGVGTFAVQIAKALGAEVTGVCSARNLELVRSLGADQAIDYARDDFTRGGRQYDLIIDNVGNRSVADYRRALAPGGTCVIVGFTSMALMLQYQVLGRLVSRISGKTITGMLAQIRKADLIALKELIEAGKLTPVIDRRYPLDAVAEATRYLETRHASGKIVISMAPGAEQSQTLAR